MHAATDTTTHPYDLLTPDTVLEAVESRGLVTDGRLLALNSYENRVYQVGLEDTEPVIVKFYRPGRWSDEQIHEEHAFSRELAAAEIPVICPLPDADGATLGEYQGFRFAVFPRRGGHAMESDNDEQLEVMGRWLARFHNVGAVRPFVHRETLTVAARGHESATFLEKHFVPADLVTPWRTLVRDLLQRVEEIWQAAPFDVLRCHGDCHVGNVLWRGGVPNFVDLDDACMAPAIQDLWMLLSGDRQSRLRQLDAVLEGYRDFRDFDLSELRLIEPLRALRMLHFAAWIGRRWHDPAFPRAFPWFDSPRYWGDLILDLRSQLAELDEPPLQPFG